MSLNDELAARQEKLTKLKNLDINIYPEKFEVNTATDKLSNQDRLILPDLPTLKKDLHSKFSLAGRVMTWREHGKIIFAHLQDNQGQIQIAFAKDVLGKDFASLELLDRGDWIGVRGDLFLTKTNEITLLINSWVFLGKALRPLPEKWHGLKDQEIKYRQRYLDLIMNPQTRQIFKFRSDLIKKIRQFYWQEGFTEVETPVFMHQATGANAQPYQTHHNALNLDVFLRISLELPLKELIVGGFEKIFELGRAFRNEGIDPSHLPEYTSLEHYVAFWNWEDNVSFTEKMFDYIFSELNLKKTRKILDREGKSKIVDFSTPFTRLSFLDLIEAETGLAIKEYDQANKLRADLKRKKIVFEGMEKMNLANLVDNMYKKVCRPKLINPVILYNYPLYMQPLARRNDNNPELVDQFQLVVNGWELVKAYSELVDPVDQKQRFIEQAEARAKGDSEAQAGDDDYIVAMEYGLPPISGWGLGVDRLVAILTCQSNLRDVVLFPLTKPESRDPSGVEPDFQT